MVSSNFIEKFKKNSVLLSDLRPTSYSGNFQVQMGGKFSTEAALLIQQTSLQNIVLIKATFNSNSNSIDSANPRILRILLRIIMTTHQPATQSSRDLNRTDNTSNAGLNTIHHIQQYGSHKFTAHYYGYSVIGIVFSHNI